MAHTNFQFTSESVSEGHPDKVCDQISDAVLDAFLENDIKLGIADDSKVNTRLGCETLSTTNKIVIAGEGRGQAPFFHKHGDKAVVDRELIAQIARDVVKDIGYDQDGFSYYGADVEVLLHGQSPDIAMGVDAKQPGTRCLPHPVLLFATALFDHIETAQALVRGGCGALPADLRP